MHKAMLTLFFNHNLTVAHRGLANKLPDKLIIKRHIPMGANAQTYTLAHLIIRHPCDHTHTRTHSIANTHILTLAHVDSHDQALSLDKR